MNKAYFNINHLGLGLIILCAILSSCHDRSNKETLSCLPIQSIDTLMNAGQVILLGEIHGTQEGPGFVEQIICHSINNNLSISVGLELPRDEEPVIKSFLESKGEIDDMAKVLELPFWSQEYQDGRASQAMYNLIDYVRRLKSIGSDVDIFLYDDMDAEDRDLAMAQNIIRIVNKDPTNLVIVLSGNYHNIIYEGSGQMGSFVIDALGEQKVISLLQSYSGGSAWVDVGGGGFGPVRLSGSGGKEMGVFLRENMDNYHGTLEVDSIHYSRPAKELLNVAKSY